MPKRKVQSESDKEPKKKLKSQTTEASVSKLSFDSPEQCFRALVFPTSLEDFFAKYWGKEPLFVARKDEEYYKGFPQRTKLEEIAKKEHLVYDKDVFINSQAEGNSESEPEGRATLTSIQKYFNEKNTLLLDKPHRFHDELRRLLQLLEGYFGCCAYCCLEVHAEDPHTLQQPGYDGKEDFILQIEGRRKWCLYKPIQKLAFLDSEDISKNDIGEVIHEFVLEPGDVLYFPRGTVYQTHMVPGQVSSHISIQVYEEYTWGHFLSKIITKAVNDALKNENMFREALPINFLSYMGFGKKELRGDMNGMTEHENTDKESLKGKAVVPKTSKIDVEKQKLLKTKLEEILPTLGQYLDPHWGADNFYGKTFIDERLPPKQDVGKPAETEKPPTDDSLVLLKHPDHIRITMYDTAEEDIYDDEDDDDEKESEVNASMEEDVVDEDSDKKPEISKKEIKVGMGKDKKSQKTKTDAYENGKDEQMPSDDELDESCESKPCIVLHHSLYNKFEFEDEDLGDEETDNKLTFPIQYCDALLVLHRSCFPVAVHNLPLTLEERVELATTLWCEGLLTEIEKS